MLPLSIDHDLKLFTKNGEGRDETVGALWRYSLSPLLEQYLSGIDTAERDIFLKKQY